MTDLKNMDNLKAILIKLCEFWEKFGCILVPPCQTEISAPLFHPTSFFGMANDKVSNIMYLQPHVASHEFLEIIQNYSFLKFQVIIKSKIDSPQKLFLESLSKLGLDIKNNNIIFQNEKFENFIFRINSDGYRVFLNGISVCKIHYIQNIGKFISNNIPIAIEYDLDKIMIIAQNSQNLWDLCLSSKDDEQKVFYKDVFYNSEKQNYDFVLDDTNNSILFNLFENFKSLATDLLNKKNIIPAYNASLKAKYYLDILNLRGCILHNDRISENRILRELIDRCCDGYCLINKSN